MIFIIKRNETRPPQQAHEVYSVPVQVQPGYVVQQEQQRNDEKEHESYENGLRHIHTGPAEVDEEGHGRSDIEKDNSP
jgi:hypothetical protein